MMATDTNTINAEAARWFARVRSCGRAQAEREGLAAWLEHPENAAAFARMEQLWTASEALRTDPEIQRVTAAALRRSRARVDNGRWLRWLVPSVGVAALVAAIILIRPFSLPNEGATFESAYRTEHLTSEPFHLPDGSTLRLSVRSQVHVTYDEYGRHLVVESGEAAFDVSRDADRPFIVRAGELRVKATGTRFSVRKFPDRVGVALVEGAVEVRSEGSTHLHVMLEPGQYLELNATGESLRRSINPSTALAWTEGKLVFESVPVSEAIEEFHRYAPNEIPLDLLSSSVARQSMPITGVFDITDPASFVAALSAMLPAANTLGSEPEGLRRSEHL
jgi:transmembrane sensor